jgi:hypothetical protein
MRSRTWKLVRLAAPLGLIPLFACLSPPVESPKTTVTQETSVRVEQSVKNKVDLLFMIDNSPSMAPKQAELRNRFPQLIKALDTFAAQGNPASYHIGVVNSDLGAGPYTLNQGQCHPGGDGAKLQTAPAASAVLPMGVSCTNFALSGGAHYIDYNQLNNTTNFTGVPDVATAFTCISSVGDAGCGFEHQMEATYRALHDAITENANFLRADAILAVVFVTDEDDCSAPATSDLFDPSTNGVNMYGVLHSFRCTQFGIQCNGQPVPPMSISNLTGCSSQVMASGGKLFDPQKYIDFFTKPAALGGVKVDPNDVILVGITAPQDPVGVQITMPCADQVNTASCPILNHSCVAATNAQFFGDPAVRINSVIGTAKHNNLTSICDTDYTSAIQALGDLIISQIGAGCLNSPIANRADGTPDCVVEDVTAQANGTTTTTEVPSCAENNHTVPCWLVVDKLAQYKAQGCTPTAPEPMTCMLPVTCQPVTNPLDGSQQLVTVSIDRGLDSTGKPNAAPPGTTANVSCATIASSM